MSYQPITTTISRRSLAIASTVTLNQIAIVGTCTGVSAGTKLVVSASGLQANTVGVGPGVGPAANAAAFYLGGGAQSVTIFGCAIDSSAAVTAKNVPALVRVDGVASGSASSSAGQLTVAGTPNDGGLLVVEVVSTVDGGRANTIFRYSWDDGLSWVESFTGAATKTLLLKTGTGTYGATADYLGLSGLTLTITPTAAGSFVVGDRFGVQIASPRISTSANGIAAAAALIAADSTDCNFVVVANTSSDNTTRTNDGYATAYNNDLALLKTAVETTLYNVGRYAQGVMGAPYHVMSLAHATSGATAIDSDESSVLQTASFVSVMLSNVATTSYRMIGSIGHFLQGSNGNYNAWLPTALLGPYKNVQNNNPSESIFKVTDGPLPLVQPGRLDLRGGTVQKYNGPAQYGSTLDEREFASGTNLGYVSPAGYLSLTTDTNGADPKAASFYLTGGNARTTPDNDFFKWQRSVLMDVFIRVVNNAMWLMKGQKFTAKNDGSGQLSDESARAIENACCNAVKSTMVAKGWIRDMIAPYKFVNVTQTNNFVSDSKIYGVARMPAVNYGEEFIMNFAYTV